MLRQIALTTEEPETFGRLLLTLRGPKGDNTLLVSSFVYDPSSDSPPGSVLVAFLNYISTRLFGRRVAEEEARGE